MTKQDIIRKLTSRKFIFVLLYFIFNILCLTGVIPIDAQEQWKFIFAIGAAIIAYIVGEGATDIVGILLKSRETFDEGYEIEDYEEGEE